MWRRPATNGWLHDSAWYGISRVISVGSAKMIFRTQRATQWQFCDGTGEVAKTEIKKSSVNVNVRPLITVEKSLRGTLTLVHVCINRYQEFIVYNINQCKIRYLLRLNTGEDDGD